VTRPQRLLVVDPVACDGHGVCAELLPEMVELDPWGYPIIDTAPMPPALDRQARRAVAACPRLALHLLEIPAARDRGRADARRADPARR
jgi:ferredoxin